MLRAPPLLLNSPSKRWSRKWRYQWPPPLHSHPLCRRLLLLQGSHLLFKPWNKRNMVLMPQLPPSLLLQNQKTLWKLENRRHPQVVHTPESLGFYSRLFLVPKPGNCWRPVIDLSSLNKFLAIPKFKMETPESSRASLRKGEWVTSIDLTDAYLHMPIHTQSQKYLGFHFKGVTYQFTSLPFGLATAPLIFTSIVKEVNLIAVQSGIRLHQYLDDWLIHAPSEQCTVQTPKLLKLVKDLGFIVNLKKSELKPSQRFDFLGYHFLLDLALVKPTQDRWTKLQEMFYPLSLKSVISARTLMSTTGLLASMVKTKIGQDAYETFSVASQNSLEISDASGHTDPLESEDDMTRGMVVRPSKCATRRTSPPQGTRKTDIYRRLKCRLGRSLRSKFYRRALVSFRKAPSHQPIRNEDGSGSAILQDRLQEQSSPYRLRQHLSGGLYQQTGRHKISRTLCPNVENSHLVSPKQCHTQSKTRTGLIQCDSGRPLKEEPDPINRVVPFSTDFQTNFQTLGESPSGPVCNQPEQKPSYICLSDSGSSGMGSRCPQHSMGKPGCLRVPSHRPAAQGCTKTPITNMQDNSDSPRLADKTMVLGPSGDVSGHSKTTTTHTHSAKTITKQPLPCQPNIPEPPHLVSRSSARQEHGFTAEVAERIAAPQRLSTRSIYTSKLTVFQRWCTQKQVDFRSPSIGDICNFFWYLFNDLNRCPSTIEGYRTAITDTLGNTKQNISTNPEIARLIASFHRDKPKSSRSIPKWNLSLVLQRLTQPPFEPQEEAALKFHGSQCSY